MTNNTYMGLPQWLPELVGAEQNLIDWYARRNSYTAPSFTPPPPPREMTAADLGLPLKHWSDCAVYNGPALPAGPCDCGGWAPAAPYSFWLGADHG